MSGPAQSNEPGPPGRFRRGLRAFRDWRRSRPFWGGLLVLLGGVEILASERAPLPLVIHIGLQGLAGYLVPIVLVLCGVLLLFHPVQQLFYALLAIVLALGSWITSNLGGFFVGMLLALTGGALAFAWQRDRRQPAVQGSGQGPGPGGQGPATDQRDPAGTPAEPDQPARPRHARSAGLALVRGSRKTGSDRADGGADGGGGGRESGGSALLAAPLAPLAMTMLAAISSRG
ncbi:MAG TPA: DUF6114 domain-containing protein, partial [Streptosporangiaceae bacterium]